MDREWRINRMMRQFNRWGGVGKETWLYDDASQEIREVIRGKVSLDDREVGLVAYFHDPGTWTLLTSDRLIGETKSAGFDVDLQAIRRIAPDWVRIPDMCKGMLDADGNVRERPIETFIVEADQKTYTVSIEGPFKSLPHLGLWNATLIAMRGRPERS